MAGVDDGKLLYRDWLTSPNNGPLLHVSPPTGDGEMVCAMEREYYLNFTSVPDYNNPYYAYYDGTNYYTGYTTSFDGLPMYTAQSLLSVYVGNAYPHRGIIPFPDTIPNVSCVTGIFRSGKVFYHDPNYPQDDDEWPCTIRPFLNLWAGLNYTEVGTGKKLFLLEPTHAIYMFVYPSDSEIQHGTPRPQDPDTFEYYSFQDIVNITQNWTWSEWADTYNHSGRWWTWDAYVSQIYRKTIGWNYRVKGYGTVLPTNAATPTWLSANHIYTYADANAALLQNQGSFNISIR